MKKILIAILTGVLLLMTDSILIEKKAASESRTQGKEILGEHGYSERKDIAVRLADIMEKYKLPKITEHHSTEDLKKSIKELNDLRRDIEKSHRRLYLIDYIDHMLDDISYNINFRKYETGEYQSFSPLRVIKKQILNSEPILSSRLIRTRKDKIKHTQKLRKKVFELIGYSPKNSFLNSRTIKKIDCGEYIMEKIIFDSEFGVSVPGYLLIPKNISFPAPAVIALHQHAGEYRFGADEVIGIAGNEPDQFYAKELVERGYITFAIDARCFGERITEDEHLVDCLARWIGKSTFGMIVWDDIRAVDYLLTRDEVDPNRIGCIGHSMGGGRATYLAALDERIKVAVVSCYVTSYKTLIENGNFSDPPSTWLPGILKYADCQDVLSLVAPRPLLIINGEEDNTVPIKGMLNTYNSLKRIYSIFKAENKLKKIEMKDISHSFPGRIREVAYQWFEKWL